MRIISQVCILHSDTSSRCGKNTKFKCVVHTVFKCVLHTLTCGVQLTPNKVSVLGQWPHTTFGVQCTLIFLQCSAGATSGTVRGAAARTSAKFPKALYVHCAAYRLNLCIMKCCKNREVSNMMETVSSVAHFFNNSPKRQLALEKWITEVLPYEEK